jgi:hypothetical protein
MADERHTSATNTNNRRREGEPTRREPAALQLPGRKPINPLLTFQFDVDAILRHLPPPLLG